VWNGTKKIAERTSSLVASPALGGEITTRLAVFDKMSLSSRKKAPKNGTNRHSGIASALANARSYSTDMSAAERKSSRGTDSFSVIDSQNGFNFVDLWTPKYTLSARKIKIEFRLFYKNSKFFSRDTVFCCLCLQNCFLTQ